ncbi:hypothetical protein SCATT_13460 [Streptantibioticus cattleyicolor NRRL 8057 = DSM 46488]|uniref:Uncharacterized protein n=1 Tax=Streptantibioticus cattleyicolor (strain ATCC 35852 / DSM 46488 / JCM 4925 / NBRC 14057 / NRRL 8057) TaxID=1003195 RepID=G8WW61_STREN|nr:hypothetical protein SCATT_13460 [Streptantibioticus cattleyicolor NRRL 8057 = DSM 46488]
MLTRRGGGRNPGGAATGTGERDATGMTAGPVTRCMSVL